MMARLGPAIAPAARNAHWIIRAIPALAVEGGYTLSEIATISGIGRALIWKWLHRGTQPSLYNVEAVLNTLGYRLALEPIAPDVDRLCRFLARRDLRPDQRMAALTGWMYQASAGGIAAQAAPKERAR